MNGLNYTEQGAPETEEGSDSSKHEHFLVMYSVQMFALFNCRHIRRRENAHVKRMGKKFNISPPTNSFYNAIWSQEVLTVTELYLHRFLPPLCHR